MVSTAPWLVGHDHDGNRDVGCEIMKMTPIVRALLIGLAAAVAAVPQAFDTVPDWLQIALAAVGATLAGAGIIPPQVPVRTVVDDPATPDELRKGRTWGRHAGYGIIEVLIVVLLVLAILILVSWLL